MTNDLVPCPDNGRCGHQTHYRGSAAYQECQRCSPKSHCARHAPSAPSFASFEDRKIRNWAPSNLNSLDMLTRFDMLACIPVAEVNRFLDGDSNGELLYFTTESLEIKMEEVYQKRLLADYEAEHGEQDETFRRRFVEVMRDLDQADPYEAVMDTFVDMVAPLPDPDGAFANVSPGARSDLAWPMDGTTITPELQERYDAVTSVLAANGVHVDEWTEEQVRELVDSGPYTWPPFTSLHLEFSTSIGEIALKDKSPEVVGGRVVLSSGVEGERVSSMPFKGQVLFEDNHQFMDARTPGSGYTGNAAVGDVWYS